MQFDSFEYLLLFLPLVIVGFLITRSIFSTNLVLTSASILCYGWAEFWFVYPMLFSALLDYLASLGIAGTENIFWRRFYLGISVVLNLGMLGACKYAGWMAAQFNGISAALGMGMLLPVLTLPLPPGISFYTFQTLGYTIDVYRRQYQPQRNVVNYLSFVTFFPQLVAGPIERAQDLLPQLNSVRPRPASAVMASALFQICWGLFKKIVIADNLGDLIQHMPGDTAGSGYLFTYAFCFQIYCDFSAYIDIARGSAALVGVKLTRNFMTPYLSASPSEFWQRWHISLSVCIRDFIYIPLGGNRRGTARMFANLIVTMVIAGFWHGAGWTFLLWGLYHGLLSCFYYLFPIHQWLKRGLGRFGHVLAIIIMFNLVCVGWALFRAESLSQLGQMNWAVLPLLHGGLYAAPFVYLFFLILPIVVSDCIAYRRNCEFSDMFPSMNTAQQVTILVAIFYALVFLGRRVASAFIYFQF